MITRITLLLEISPQLTKPERRALREEAVDVLNTHLDFGRVLDSASTRSAYFVNSADDI